MLSGDLAEFPFPSLVGALMSAGRTGRLHLRPPFLEAEVYLRGGQVVHAKAQAGERVLEGEEALDLLVAAARGYIDDVIDPTHTRRILYQHLRMLWEKQEERPRKKHDNIPL